MNSKLSTHEFKEIYERYKATLYRIAFTYLKNNEDVEDVLQEVFLKRLYKAPRFENEKQEKYWMIRVTINLSKDVLKSFWRKNIDSIEEMQEIKYWQFSKEEKDIFQMVMSLPVKQKLVIYLHYYEGYTCKEIAEILRCKESAIKMRLKKGRELLKIDLEMEE